MLYAYTLPRIDMQLPVRAWGELRKRLGEVEKAKRSRTKCIAWVGGSIT
jgi:hypothetical protein